MIYSLMDACREDMPQYANKLAFQFQSLLKDDYEATRREHQLFSPLATRLVEMLSTVAESYSITRVLEEGDGTLLAALAKIGHCLTGQGILEPERPLIEHMRGMGFKPERMVALLQQNKSWQVAYFEENPIDTNIRRHYPEHWYRAAMVPLVARGLYPAHPTWYWETLHHYQDTSTKTLFLERMITELPDTALRVLWAAMPDFGHVCTLESKIFPIDWSSLLRDACSVQQVQWTRLLKLYEDDTTNWFRTKMQEHHPQVAALLAGHHALNGESPETRLDSFPIFLAVIGELSASSLREDHGRQAIEARASEFHIPDPIGY